MSIPITVENFRAFLEKIFAMLMRKSIARILNSDYDYAPEVKNALKLLPNARLIKKIGYDGNMWLVLRNDNDITYSMVCLPQLFLKPYKTEALRMIPIRAGYGWSEVPGVGSFQTSVFHQATEAEINDILTDDFFKELMRVLNDREAYRSFLNDCLEPIPEIFEADKGFLQNLKISIAQYLKERSTFLGKIRRAISKYLGIGIRHTRVTNAENLLEHLDTMFPDDSKQHSEEERKLASAEMPSVLISFEKSIKQKGKKEGLSASIIQNSQIEGTDSSLYEKVRNQFIQK